MTLPFPFAISNSYNTGLTLLSAYIFPSDLVISLVHMRRNGYLKASSQKSDHAIRSGDIHYILDGYISTIAWRLRHVFDVLCTIFIWPCDFDLRPFDICGVWWIKLHASNAHTNFSILQLSVPELCVTQFDHITITWYGHINLGNYQIIINSGMQQVFDQLICIFDVSALKLIAS